MERQRSFSIKTRFLVLSFTISSSVIFLIFFSIWVFNSTPSVLQETYFQFNKPSTVHSLTASTRNFAIESRTPILIDTLFRKPENQDGLANFSRFEGVLTKKSGTEVFGDEKDEDGAVNNNFATTFGSNERDSILASTHFRKPENDSGIAGNLAFEKLHRIKNSNALDNATYITDDLTTNLSSRKQNVPSISFHKSEISNVEKNGRFCDFTKGRWVFDERLPLYTNDSCPFIDEAFNCEGNGRSDKDYMKWRWQPRDCEIPRFNATEMLELIKGKRLVFVGDSINRNQWESLLCLLMGAIKDPKRVYETHGRRITKEKGDYSLKFLDYKCTVEYYVTHFLVHESKGRVGKKRVQTLRIDTMDRGSSRWKGADILVFNTAHWWSHYKTKAGINYYQEGGQVHPHLDASAAFRRALTTWASWVDRHVNPHKTEVFFRSSAPSHFSGGQWNSGGHCKEATQPLGNISVINYPKKNVIVQEVIRGMKTPVTILNITSLSEYRIDGHPSLYGRKLWKGSSSKIQDCSHWCLPGVPDSWNELLYFNLYLKRRGIL